MRETQNSSHIKTVEVVEFKLDNYKKFVYGNGIHAYMILNNLLTSMDFSMFDLKCIFPEDYSRYKKFNHPDKLYSYGKNKYFNFQGLRLVNPHGQKILYTKNYIKYEEVSIQKQFLRKMFSQSCTNMKNLDKESIKKLQDSFIQLRQKLKLYNINFESSSVMVYYNAVSRELKLKFLDFSYFPNPLEVHNLNGITLMINVLQEILEE